MICFECGSACITVYQNSNGRWIVSPNHKDKIIAVRKDCLKCDWYSYPTILPTSRQSILLDFDE
jgi:hypothetical protein